MNLEAFQELLRNFGETMKKVTVFKPICELFERFL